MSEIKKYMSVEVARRRTEGFFFQQTEKHSVLGKSRTEPVYTECPSSQGDLFFFDDFGIESFDSQHFWKKIHQLESGQGSPEKMCHGRDALV